MGRTSIPPLLILFSIVLVALLGAVGAFLWRSAYLDPTLPHALRALVLKEQSLLPSALGSVLPENLSPNPLEVGIPIEKLTKGWEVYRGGKVGVTFKYPGPWSVSRGTENKLLKVFVYASDDPREEDEPLIKVASFGGVGSLSLGEWLEEHSSSEVEELDFGGRSWLRPSRDKLLNNGYNNLFILNGKGEIYNFVFKIVEDWKTNQLIEFLFLTIEFL